jgi:hypothetical protein
MAAKTRDKKWEVKIQHCPISSRLYMWVDNDVPNYFPTLKNFYRRHFQNGRHKTAQIQHCPAAIFKMVTGRNFSMSGIISGHHNLPTYEMSLKSDNVEFVRYCGLIMIETYNLT